MAILEYFFPFKYFIQFSTIYNGFFSFTSGPQLPFGINTLIKLRINSYCTANLLIFTSLRFSSTLPPLQ